MLMASEESLMDLNARLSLPIDLPMSRFRPNIVVRGAGAWEEDDWQTMIMEHPQPLVVKVVTAPFRIVLTTVAHAWRQALQVIPGTKVRSKTKQEMKQ